jgi:hypothetical protein
MVLNRQAQQLTSQMATVERQTRVLTADLKALHNPVTLKAMLTGRRPLPAADVTPPATLP